MARKKTVEINLDALTATKVKTVKGDKGSKDVSVKTASSISEATQALGGKAEQVLKVLNAFFTNYQVAPIRLELNTNIATVLAGMIRDMVKSMAKLGVELSAGAAAEKIISTIPIPVSSKDAGAAIEKAVKLLV